MDESPESFDGIFFVIDMASLHVDFENLSINKRLLAEQERENEQIVGVLTEVRDLLTEIRDRL